MSNEEHLGQLALRDQLFRLLHLDVTAICVYEDAIRHATDEELQSAFEQFRFDHDQHLHELPKAIQHFGWATPELKLDLKGRLEEWVVSIRCVRGTDGLLHALWTEERRHASEYAEASRWNIDDTSLTALLQDFSEHEKRHLAFVEERVSH
jgi:hypothetical protein